MKLTRDQIEALKDELAEDPETYLYPKLSRDLTDTALAALDRVAELEKALREIAGPMTYAPAPQGDAYYVKKHVRAIEAKARAALEPKS